jgi:glycerol-3-phosphate dehydrogenase
VPASVTAETPLLGADGYRAAWNRRARTAADTGLDVARVEHLLHRYGAALDEVLALVAERPELAEPLPGAEEYLAAEAVYAASSEGALHLDDVLVRRTRIAMEAADRGLAAADPVSRHLAAVLGWTEDQRLAEVEAYRSRVQAERAAETQPDDQSAAQTRRQAGPSRSEGRHAGAG